MIGMGIDAAGSSGWGIVDVGRGRPSLITFGVCNGKDHHAIVEVVETAVTHGVQVVAIESPYVDKNVDTAIKLGVICGRWCQEFDRAGIKWISCKADTWQRKLLDGLIHAGSPREVRKKAAKQYVRAEFGREVSEDEADAICLATWRAKESAFEVKRIAAGG